jgi:uncharacterized protein
MNLPVEKAQITPVPQQLSGKGTVYSFTTVQDVPSGYEEQGPYVLALVQLEEGALVMAQITDLDDQPLKIGDAVEMVTRKLTSEGATGMIVYGYKFRKVLI